MKKVVVLFFIMAVLAVGGFYAFRMMPVSLSDKEGDNHIITYVNTDVKSNVSMVVSAPNDEMLFVMTKDVGTKKVIDQVGFQLSDGKRGVIKVNEKGLPSRIDSEGTVATFGNYTDMTVDIDVKYADGTTKVFEKSSIVPAKQLSSLFIPSAYADTATESVSSLGVVIDAVECGIGLISVLYTGGATTPLVYLKCGKVAVSTATQNTEINGCKGDIFDCMDDALWDFIHKEGWILKKGKRLKGNMFNRITGTPITNGVLNLISTNKNNKEYFRGEWNKDGTYEFYIKDGGVFNLDTISDGYKDESLQTLVTNTIVKIIEADGKVIDLRGEGERYFEVEYDILLDPAAYIKGEIIDAVEGDSIKGAEISLLDETGSVDDDFTDARGTFMVMPPVSDAGKNFKVQVSAQGYKTQVTDVFISYEVIPESDEYEIDNWSGIIKLEKGTGEYVMEMTYLAGEKVACGDFTQLPLRFKIVDNKVVGGEIISLNSGEKIGSNWQLEGTVKNGQITFSIGGFFMPSLNFIGNMSGETARGTYATPSSDGGRSGEKHHKRFCNGSWTATKQ